MTGSLNQMLATLPNRTPEERKTMRERALRQMGGCNQAAAKAASQLVKAIDELEQALRDELMGELKGMTAAERVVRAFTVEPMSETEAKIIQVLLDNPGSTNRELSRKLGWNDNGFDLHFGMMCRDRSVYLWPAPDAEKRDGKFYSGILAEYDEDGSSFTMKPEVAAAFTKLGLKGKGK